MAAIIQKLGSLPLALDHAGSYIFRQQCSFRSYLKELQANINFHLNKGWKQGDDQESVSASWEMSFNVLEQRAPKATDLLSICGFLDNEDICEEFLRRGMNIEDNGGYLHSFCMVRYIYLLCMVRNRDWIKHLVYLNSGTFL